MFTAAPFLPLRNLPNPCFGRWASQLFVAAFFLLTPTTAAGQAAAAPQAGSLSGTVTTTTGEPVPDAVVTLVDLKRRTRADGAGAFHYAEVPAGPHLVLAESLALGQGSAQVDVKAGEEARAGVVLDLAHLHDAIVVSAGASPRQQLAVAQPTSVLTAEDLDRRRSSTLGETLAEQPGVSSTYFGPGASRPVIRGLGGDRVRMLSDGLGSADASNVSPDHAVAIDPLSADRIEVLRGPSTLLYGSTAIGGVVNVLDHRIPEFRADGPIAGELSLGASSVANGKEGALALDGGQGAFAWHADYLQRESGDTSIPGLAALPGAASEGESSRPGRLVNSAADSDAAGVGLSWVGEAGVIGLGVSRFNTFYGVPNEADVKIDLEQRRVDLKGELLRPFGPFSGLKLRLGNTDYEHAELEGDEIGTRFLSQGTEGRLELVQRSIRGLSGSCGLQFGKNDFAAVGEEAFVPPSTTETAAAFFFEELRLGERWRLQAGGRYEQQRTTVDAELPDRALPDRDSSGLSASLGVVWEPAPQYAVIASLARSVRLPTSTELYADGPHVATNAFEIGDPDLRSESSLGLDLSLRKRTGRLTGTLSAFVNRISDYVFESNTGEEEDGLAVIRFIQQDARFRGFELEGELALYRGEDSHLDLLFGADAVRAELRATGEPLPRIPPARGRLGLSYHRGPWRTDAEVLRIQRQGRVSEHETPTAGYTLVNAGVSRRFFVAGRVLDLLLRGRNLTDEEARDHVSFIKDLAPLPGRDIGLSLRFAF